jgi:UDP-N-acetylglucosamine 2-epimerase (non-hydrolysing)
MAPVLMALAKRPYFESMLVATGQHGSLFDEALAPFGLAPDRRLETVTAGLDPDAMALAIEASLTPLLRDLQPRLVLVQGDTTSALAAARAAVACGVPVGHVEAGLRSHDLQRPWPEEGNRIAIDHLATLLFAPTEGNLANLAADPLIGGQAWLTGNSGIDALLHICGRFPGTPRRSDRHEILVTLHRRETIGEPLRRICAMLRRLADRGDVAITLPLHPNPHVRTIIAGELENHGAIALVEPFSYPEMIARMAAADLILSDSGGVQEEAPALGVPLLVLRDVTERPEAVDCGAARLAGTDADMILTETLRLLDDPDTRAAMAIPRFPFGRGDAASKIVTLIENYLRSQNVT